MKVVALLGGTKGGIGKTTIAHALCLGAGIGGHISMLLHTDDQDPVECDGRPYQYFDARDPHTLKLIMDAARKQECLAVIDGGANMTAMRDLIVPYADLIISPVSCEQSEINECLNVVKSLPSAKTKVMINKWSSNHQTKLENEREYVSQIPKGLIIGNLPLVNSVRRFTRSDTEGWQVSTKARSFAKKTHGLINPLLMRQAIALVPEAAHG